MLEKLKKLNLIEVKTKQNTYSKIKGGMILTVHFKRTLLETNYYRFSGICICYRKKGISSSVIIRNVISLYPLEYTFNLYSPLVSVMSRTKKNEIKFRSKLYFLRHKPAPLSKVEFKYVI